MYIFAIIVNIILIIIDQFTKKLAVEQLQSVGSIPIIEGIFHFTYVENRGAAFGIFQGGRWFFLILSIIILFGLCYYYIRLPKGGTYNLVRASIILISSGALGNMIDRISQGYVVDFLYFSLIDFPVFNMADIFVVTGTILLAILLLFFVKDEEIRIKKNSQAKEQESAD